MHAEWPATWLTTTPRCAESLLHLPDLDCQKHSPLVDPLENVGVEVVTELTEQCYLVHVDLCSVVGKSSGRALTLWFTCPLAHFYSCTE